MARGWIHTVYRGGAWLNEVEGSGPVGPRHERKEDAVAAGRELARERRTEHLIHNMDGAISERNSYERDPFPPRG